VTSSANCVRPTTGSSTSAPSPSVDTSDAPITPTVRFYHVSVPLPSPANNNPTDTIVVLDPTTAGHASVPPRASRTSASANDTAPSTMAVRPAARLSITSDRLRLPTST